MTPQEMLSALKLLSAMESLLFAREARIPDYMIEQLNDVVAALERELLK